MDKLEIQENLIHIRKPKSQKIGWLFVAVPLTVLLLFTMIPIVVACYLSLTNYNVVQPIKYIAFKNFNKIFNNDTIFRTALYNTARYTLFYVPLGYLLALGAALFLNANKKGVGLFRTLFYLPVLSSTVATSLLWFMVLNPNIGLLNTVLGWFGINGPAWLYKSQYAMYGILMMCLWAGFGGNMMILLAGLKSISTTYYEASYIDGANAFQRFIYITMPSLKSTSFYVTTMLIIHSFQIFDQAYVLTSGGPGNSTLTLVYYVYQKGFGELRMGYACAMSLILFVIIFLVSMLNMYIRRNRD